MSWATGRVKVARTHEIPGLCEPHLVASLRTQHKEHPLSTWLVGRVAMSGRGDPLVAGGRRGPGGGLGVSGDGSTLTEARESSGEPTAEASGEVFDVDDPDLEGSLRSFYDEFLLASDCHRTPGEQASREGSGLADLASPAVVAEHDAWRAANEAHGEGFQRVVTMESSANVSEVNLEGARPAIVDCTVETATMISGQDVRAYVSRVVQVATEGGRLAVVDVGVTHEGKIDSPGYSCVPGPLAESARATVEEMEAAYARAQADPRVGMAEPLAGLVADPLESELASALADQARLGISNTSPSESTLVVEGIDPRGLGLVVVVSVCATYPEGLAARDLGSGEVVREVSPPGARSRWSSLCASTGWTTHEL